MSEKKLPPPGNTRGEFKCPRCGQYRPRETFVLVLTGKSKNWRCEPCRQRKAAT